ncbi:MAG: insulinase family protein [Planctomycetes bacterium]|nr:insulinase family protein [Planctomycetota bacterium]MBI3845719.1 insulinase family protein [Planctomycetota bacterium]
MHISRKTGAAALGIGVSSLFGSPSASADGVAQLEVVKHTLQNGMRLLLVERHDSPTVATYLRFHVGAVDDPKGQTGIAHLLEHMMFKGTRTFGTTSHDSEVPIMDKLDRLFAERDAELAKRRAPFTKPDEAKIADLTKQIEAATADQKKFVVKDELWQIYQRLGGDGLNASTGEDSTQYYVTLPSNQLEVWAYLEADRIANPVFREFYSERDVVHEERRLRTDTQPHASFREAFDATAFAAHPYRNPVVGWPTDIDATVRAEVLQFFRTYYAPNNCVAVLVGDLDPKKTIALVEKYFGPIPAQPPPRRAITEEPPHRGERRIEMTADAAPSVTIAYPSPAAGDPASYPLRVAARVLSGGGGGRGGGGGTGRLFKRLVVEKQVALGAFASSRAQRYPSLFTVSASPAKESSPEDLEAALTEEIERLATEPPTDEELGRVRNSIDAEAVRRLTSNFGIAGALADAEDLAGDWHYLFREQEAMKAVSSEDVRKAAAEWLRRDRRTVGILRSEKDSRPRAENVDRKSGKASEGQPQ